MAEIWIEETSPEFGVHRGFTSITKRRQCTLTAAVGRLSRLDDWLMDHNRDLVGTPIQKAHLALPV